MSEDLLVSIVIPVCNEEQNISILTEELYRVLKDGQYELLFIDDGSDDGTLEKIKEEQSSDQRIKYLSFSRNFGHQAALKAGLDHTKGDCIVMMDGDMEHPPSLIPEMIDWWQKGFDVVITERKSQRKGKLFKKISSLLFYRLMNLFSDTKLQKASADFRLLDKRVAEVIKSLPEQPLFLRGIISWLGFKQKVLAYAQKDRSFGQSKYSKARMITFSIEGITSFSIKPLRISSFMGLTLSMFAILYGVYAIYIHLFTDQSVPGWTSLMVLIAFIGGMQMIMIGVLGEYVGKLFMASKKRPYYIIKEKGGSGFDNQVHE